MPHSIFAQKMLARVGALGVQRRGGRKGSEMKEQKERRRRVRLSDDRQTDRTRKWREREGWEHKTD